MGLDRGSIQDPTIPHSSRKAILGGLLAVRPPQASHGSPKGATEVKVWGFTQFEERTAYRQVLSEDPIHETSLVGFA